MQTIIDTFNNLRRFYMGKINGLTAWLANRKKGLKSGLVKKGDNLEAKMLATKAPNKGKKVGKKVVKKVTKK